MQAWASLNPTLSIASLLIWINGDWFGMKHKMGTLLSAAAWSGSFTAEAAPESLRRTKAGGLVTFYSPLDT